MSVASVGILVKFSSFPSVLVSVFATRFSDLVIEADSLSEPLPLRSNVLHNVLTTEFASPTKPQRAIPVGPPSQVRDP